MINPEAIFLTGVVMGKKYVFRFLRYQIVIISFLLVNQVLGAQDRSESFADSVSINECISYALKHQPLVNQLKIDEKIADQDIKISLADWFPQINSGAGYQNYLKQPVSVFPNFSDPAGPKINVTTGVKNYSNLQFSAGQKLLSNDLISASRTAKFYRQQVKQTGQKEAIQLVADISKAFYDVLLSQQMLSIINDEIDRLTVSLKDALTFFKNGLKDKIDYSRATMALNSARSQKVSMTNSIIAKLAYLKQLMGYPEEKPLFLKKTIDEMKEEIMIDTLKGIRYSDRIEYKLLETDIRLQKLLVGYNRLSFLPSMSAYANYNIIYQNDDFGQLYSKSFPNSSVGLSLSLPIIEGGKRMHELEKSKLTFDRLALDTLNLRNEINTEYVQALASYRSNLAAYNLTSQTMDIARDVYNTVLSQYREGIKPYLELIISETDLKTAQLNNLNSLIMLMFSKIDVDKASGRIFVNY